jgi:hypothetical protein
VIRAGRAANLPTARGCTLIRLLLGKCRSRCLVLAPTTSLPPQGPSLVSDPIDPPETGAKRFLRRAPCGSRTAAGNEGPARPWSIAGRRQVLLFLVPHASTLSGATSSQMSCS